MKIKEILLDKYEDVDTFYGKNLADSHSIPKGVSRLFETVREVDKCLAGRFVIAEEGTIWFVPVDSMAMHDSPEKQIQRDAKIIGLTGIGGECVQISKIVKKRNESVYKSLLDTDKLRHFKSIHDFFYNLKNMTDSEIVKELIKYSEKNNFDVSKSHRSIIKNLFSYRDNLLDIFDKNMKGKKKLTYKVEPETKLDKIIAGFTNRFNYHGGGNNGYYNHNYRPRVIELTEDEHKSNLYRSEILSLQSLFAISSMNHLIKYDKSDIIGYADYKSMITYLEGSSHYNSRSNIPMPFNLKYKNKLTGFSNKDTEIDLEGIESRIHNHFHDARNSMLGGYSGHGGNRYNDQLRDEYERAIDLIGNFHEFTLFENNKGLIKVTLNVKNFGSKILNDKATEIVKEFTEEINKDNLPCYYDVYRKYGLELKKLTRIKDEYQTVINELNYQISTSENSIERAKKELEESSATKKEKLEEAKKYGLKLNLTANL